MPCLKLDLVVVFVVSVLLLLKVCRDVLCHLSSVSSTHWEPVQGTGSSAGTAWSTCSQCYMKSPSRLLSAVPSLPICAAAPPRILDVSVEGREPSGYRAVCRVQGSPPPDVQWLDLENQLKVVGPQDRGSVGGPLDRGTAPRFHTVSQLRDVEPGRQYTCSASNPLGREQSTLYVAAPQAGLAEAEAPPSLLLLLSVSLGAKVILLVGLGLWLAQGGFSSWWKQPVVK